MTDINKIGERAATKIKSIAKTKHKLDEQSKVAQPELAQVWAALEAGTPVNGCKSKKEWAAKWKISDRMCRYILKGRKPRTGEHRHRAVPLKVGTVVNIDPAVLDDPDLPKKLKVASSRKVTRNGLGQWVVELVFDAVEKEKQPTPKKKAKRYSTKVPGGDFITMPTKPHKTHKMQPGGKRTWCGKRPGETLAIDARMSDNPTCHGCRNGENTDLLRKAQPIVRIKHIFGGASAGGGQNTRMYSYALCGRNLTRRSMVYPASGRIHESVLPGENPTCEKCAELAKKAQESENLSEPAKALAAAVDAAPVPYDAEAYAKAENWSQKVCVIGSPENLKWHADLEYRRNNPVVDPNADDEFAGERD